MKLPLKSGDEHDLFSRWRHCLHWQSGEKKKIKRRYNKRVRRCMKMAVRWRNWKTPHSKGEPG